MDNNVFDSSKFINSLSMNSATSRPSSYDNYLHKLEAERRKQVIQELADNLRRSSASHFKEETSSKDSSPKSLEASI